MGTVLYFPYLLGPPGCQFHQRFTCAFFVRKSFFGSFFLVSNPKPSFVIFGAKILYKKRARKMLMKLTPSVH